MERPQSDPRLRGKSDPKRTSLLFRVLNDEVELDRGHARAVVELLLPGIKRRMEEERSDRDVN